jgi:hypothetical protein
VSREPLDRLGGGVQALARPPTSAALTRPSSPASANAWIAARGNWPCRSTWTAAGWTASAVTLARSSRYEAFMGLEPATGYAPPLLTMS